MSSAPMLSASSQPPYSLIPPTSSNPPSPDIQADQLDGPSEQPYHERERAGTFSGESPSDIYKQDTPKLEVRGHHPRANTVSGSPTLSSYLSTSESPENLSSVPAIAKKSKASKLRIHIQTPNHGSAPNLHDIPNISLSPLPAASIFTNRHSFSTLPPINTALKASSSSVPPPSSGTPIPTSPTSLSELAESFGLPENSDLESPRLPFPPSPKIGGSLGASSGKFKFQRYVFIVSIIMCLTLHSFTLSPGQSRKIHKDEADIT